MTPTELIRARHRVEKGWVLFSEVSDDAANRRADLVALYCWIAPYLVGYEVKRSRQDWLRELEEPGKRAWVEATCRFRWFVVEPKVAKEVEVPEGWGLLEHRGGRLVRVRAAPAVDVDGPSKWIARLLYQQEQLLVKLRREKAEEQKFRDPALLSREKAMYDREAAMRAEHEAARQEIARGKAEVDRFRRELGQATGLSGLPSIPDTIRAFEGRAARRVVDQARRARDSMEYLVSAAEAGPA